MYFQSAGFLFLFLPVTLLITSMAPKGILRTLSLVLLSYLFYSGAEPFFALILLFSSVTDFYVAIAIASTERKRLKKLYLAISLSINLALLAFFKYGAMIGRGVSNLGDGWSTLLPNSLIFETFVLPPGISFYTFQSLSYSIDVYRGQVEPTRNLWGFLAYIAYLPQLIAGPIERFHNLYPQLQKWFDKQERPQWSAGLDRIAVGVVQKLLIADSCGRLVDVLVGWHGTHSLISGWMTALAFGMQIYYDFAGYTNMAIGVSMCFGIRLSENFLSPYKARNIQDFWRRWHVTLSFWFRDYLYIPLGGSRGSRLRTVFNLLLTFALCGLWHGAGVNFVVWGCGHGVLLAGFHILRRTFPNFRLSTPLSVGLTFLMVNFLWIVFRVSDPGTVLNLWKGMLGMSRLGAGDVLPWDMTFIGAVTVATWLLPNCAQRWPGRSGAVESLAIWATAVFVVVTSPQIHQFIYFQF